MPIRALATDYDGTIASHGVVSPATLAALKRLKASGRQLMMVTGRELPDLRSVFPALDLFDAVVAENGALLYRPGVGEQLLTEAPPPALIDELRRRGVAPLAVGRAIVATLSANAAEVAAAIEAHAPSWGMIFNKDSVMVLAEGVDKASGLMTALPTLGLEPAQVLGVGDAENDQPFLAICGLSAAVGNALPALKAEVDLVTEGDEGDGVAWLIERLLDGGLEAPDADRPLRVSPADAGSS